MSTEGVSNSSPVSGSQASSGAPQPTGNANPMPSGMISDMASFQKAYPEVYDQMLKAWAGQINYSMQQSQDRIHQMNQDAEAQNG
jgi:hypothetical protein